MRGKCDNLSQVLCQPSLQAQQVPGEARDGSNGLNEGERKNGQREG